MPGPTTLDVIGCELQFAFSRGWDEMNSMTRRRFLQYGAGAGAALTVPWLVRPSAAVASNGARLEKFIQALPVPGNGIVVASGADRYAFTQVPILRKLHPALPETPLWAYDDGSGLAGQAGSFGMVILARTGTPVDATYTNGLPLRYPGWIPVDTRLTPTGDAVRAMTHLHGGFVAGTSDGNPAVTPNGFGQGDTQTVHYPNQQPASLLWFHDHGPGTTRLNVFAGLAGGYLIRDRFDTGTEPNPVGIPGGAYEVPLVIQDRQINSDGTLNYPTSTIPGVTWIGEYFGDVMLVNGKVWPYLNVEPRMYRFRILNGCNARILNLTVAGLPFWQIGADGGMWDRPVGTRHLVLAPAERADVVVDFRGFAGTTLLLKNDKPPAPVSTPAPPLTPVLQLRVGTTVSRPGPTAVPATLPGGRAANVSGPVARRRFITLNEIGTDTATWHLNLSGLPFNSGASGETPTVGTVEEWSYVNLTGDTHPMHLHLVTFQVVGRTPFDVDGYQDAYGGDDGVPGGIDPAPFVTGPMIPAGPDELGFKDTVKANPGYVTTIRARFDLPTGVSAPQRYVHHCHIVEHEDNDMMQPYEVVA
jgi:spore coat protein A, manganese oxidase